MFKKQRLNPNESKAQAKPWVEKYRPKKLEDVAAQDHAVTVLKRTLQTANLPHMLFHGPPGTGKTSTILALTKELYGPELMKSRVLELNASDERGISIVREKVKNFARLMVSKPSAEDLEKYPCPPYKIIILDEADSMTADAQSALRRTMETYSGVTRFCLICNYVTRIIDPLASRCSKFRFKALDSSNALSRLQYISQEESLKYEEGILERILDISQGDLRKAITLLQSAAKVVQQNDNADAITLTHVNELSGTIHDKVLQDLISVIESKDLNSIMRTVQDFVNQGWSAASALTQLHDYYIKNDHLDTDFKNKVSWLLFDSDSKLTSGANEHLQLLNLSMKISQLY
ncbi:Subunit of heteropentameric Replication factor C (RF-C) [Kluyveromyces marxianus]|nr:Subunit of heteropentameric Replication factor C (RF-C) [Kluyveromyces marxianus]KAG0682520.1 Subunit of heteropentameric Replication factor C (RF-C) [Kluyveromyces marxianus]